MDLNQHFNVAWKSNTHIWDISNCFVHAHLVKTMVQSSNDSSFETDVLTGRKFISVPRQFDDRMMSLLHTYLQERNRYDDATTFPKPLTKPFLSLSSRWERDFVRLFAFSELPQLMYTAEYWGVVDLTRLLSAYLASRLQHRSVKYLRKKLNLVDCSNDKPHDAFSLDACRSQWNHPLFGDPGVKFWRCR